VRNSGAEGYRFEPYRAYQRINNLAERPFLLLLRGQIGDKFSAGWFAWDVRWSNATGPDQLELARSTSPVWS